MKRKIFFPKRIPEPRVMGKIEQAVFGKISLENYQRWFIPLADEVIEKSSVRLGKIADIACGPGLLAKEFALRSQRWNVVGIDNSSHAIHLAEVNCKGLSNVSLKVGSVYRLPFRNESFDIVTCKDSLHHFDNPKLALREMWRIVRQGGLLYVQDLRRDLPYYLLKRVIPPRTTFEKLQFYSARAAYTKQEVEKMLRVLHIRNHTIRTRKVLPPLMQLYAKKGIDIGKLNESFQSRYVVIAKKSKMRG